MNSCVHGHLSDMHTHTEARGFVALMYHGVGEAADPKEGVRYTVTLPEFERQLEALERTGVRILHPAQAGGEGSSGVVLTFDDGEASVIREALPRLARRGAPAALFMTTAWLGRPGYLDAAGLRELAAAGWVIGSHGHTHRFLNTLDDRQLQEELERSRDVLGTLLGHAPSHLAFPGGRTSQRVEERARELGFQTLWSSRPGLNSGPGSRATLRRTAVRRGDEHERFVRLARGERLAHWVDSFRMGSRGLVRRLVGEERYHQLTARLLCLLGQR